MGEVGGVYWSSNFVEIHNTSIHYWQSSNSAADLATAGQLSLPILIFLHGFFFDGALYIVPLTKFAQYFTVILPDARAHGYSNPIPLGSFTFQNIISDTVSFIQYMSPENKVLLGGHSMGAALAAHVTNRIPSQIAGLLLEEPPWNRPPGVPYCHSGYLNVSSQSLDASAAFTFVKSSRRHKNTLKYPAEDDETAAGKFSIENVTEKEVLDADVEITEAVFNITVPVLLQIGDLVTLSSSNSTRLNPSVAKLALETFPSGRLECFENGPHVLHGQTLPNLKWLNTSLSYYLKFPVMGNTVDSGDVFSEPKGQMCHLESWTKLHKFAVVDDTLPCPDRTTV